MPKAEELAETFHRVYEKLAPKFGYKTRKRTRKHWDDLPENNKELMIAVAQVVLNKYSEIPEITEKDLQAWADEAECRVEDEKRWSPLLDVMKEMLEELGIKVKK